MPPTVTLDGAKGHLSAPLDRAVAGEEIVIARNGIPHVRMIQLAVRGEPRRPASAKRICHIAADFDASAPAIQALFGAGHPR